MARSPVFEWVCDALEQRTDLERLEARGTVRIALREAGLDAAAVTTDQMRVVLDKVLAGELSARAIDDPDAVCEQIAKGLDDAGVEAAPTEPSPEDVFRRLAAN